jgi:hypothetical protein
MKWVRITVGGVAQLKRIGVGKEGDRPDVSTRT